MSIGWLVGLVSFLSLALSHLITQKTRGGKGKERESKRKKISEHNDRLLSLSSLNASIVVVERRYCFRPDIYYLTKQNEKRRRHEKERRGKSVSIVLCLLCCRKYIRVSTQ